MGKITKAKPNLKLKMRKMELGYTSVDISKKLGLCYPAYINKENGIRDFTLSEIAKLLEILECKFEDLF